MAAAGMCLFVGHVQAQTSTVIVNVPGQVVGNAGSPAHPPATFQVTVTETSKTMFSFLVHNITIPPVAFLDDAQFIFYDSPGGNNSGAIPYNIVGGTSNQSGTVTFTNLGDTAKFSSAEGTFFAPADLTGTITIDNPLLTAPASFNVELFDGTHGEANGDFTPEASSLALLLPGLIPIGIALRRRRAARA